MVDLQTLNNASDNNCEESTHSEITEVQILISDDDKIGTDLTKMTDFFDTGLGQLRSSITKGDMTLHEIQDIPISDIGIISEVLNIGDAVFDNGYTWIPDFDSLPPDIRKKLEKGIYLVGDSCQVKGNQRAVILDENGIRIKDVTLKRAVLSIRETSPIPNFSNLEPPVKSGRFNQRT